jgi:glycosyltransferase involved in cell wall biosynthesis
MTTLVVPCYNEATRLDTAAFEHFLKEHPDCSIAFVNDGSTDGTLGVLKDLQSRLPQQVSVVDLPHNGGKAEAVRQGLLHALAGTPDFVAYWDADLATPLETVPVFIELLAQRPELEMVFGSRVKLMGRDIQRRKRRHYLGRVFATFASIVLSLSIYDTQCGAKMFRVSPELRKLFQKPFCSRWIFDVELIARYFQVRRGTPRSVIEASIYEFPLTVWRDVRGSKVGLADGVRAFFELCQIYRLYR